MLFAKDELQNVYVPLPLKVHVIFCIIATIIYILEIYRKKSPHYLFMMLAVDATLLMHAFPNSTMVAVLAVIEGVLLGAAITVAIIESKKRKARAALAAAEQAEDVKENETAVETEEKTDEDSDS